MTGFITGAVWSAEEDAVIVDARQIGTAARYIAKRLPGRTEDAVASRIRHLRRKGWFVGGVPGAGRPKTIMSDLRPADVEDFDADEIAFRRQAARGSAMLLAAITKLITKGETHV